MTQGSSRVQLRKPAPPLALSPGSHGPVSLLSNLRLKTPCDPLPQLLDRYLRGQDKALSVVAVPTEEQEEELIRYHRQIMADRGRCEARGNPSPCHPFIGFGGGRGVEGGKVRKRLFEFRFCLGGVAIFLCGRGGSIYVLSVFSVGCLVHDGRNVLGRRGVNRLLRWCRLGA